VVVVEVVRHGSAVAVRERLEEFGAEVLAGAMNRPAQMTNGGLYLRGLLEEGRRKSLEPLAARLGEDADYQSMQQFLSESPWDPAAVVRVVAERVTGEIDVEAWVLDDTGFPKQGKHSPGVKRQYSGTLGKTGNCQIGVSVHAVGANGTGPLGWALYLPEEWCSDRQRRRKAKIPEEITFKTKGELGVELIEHASGWEVPKAPVLGDAAYGDNTALRERLHDTEVDYVLCVSADTRIFEPGTSLAVPAPKRASGRQPRRLRPDREPKPIGELLASLDPGEWQTVAFRDGPDGQPMTSRFAFVRVRAAHLWQKGYAEEPREEWLIAECPEDQSTPTGYWLSNLPVDAEPERLARLARLRWKIELDYRQLKGELGLDH
jgi:SRSO17 transposase